MTLDYLAHLRSDAERFGDVLRHTDPSTRVPSCPEWNADDLLWHLTEVFCFWATIVRDRLSDPDAADAATPARPDDRAELDALYRQITAGLVDVLAETPDDMPVWSWADDHTVGFVRRRMAQEALVHRLDAELTAAAVTDLDPALAADGVDEALQHFYGGHPEWADYAPGDTVGRLRATDTGDEWLFRLGRWSGTSPNTGKTYADEPTLDLVDAGRPAFTHSGTARDLEAWVWNRPTLAEPAVEGDAAAFESFRAIIAKGID